MNFNFRPIVFEDWEILLKWRNDPVVRMNSHNSDLIEEEMHKTYIKRLLETKDRKQYIFSADDKEVGTIREDELGDANELSYIISPDEYGKKLGELMIRLFLYNKEGRFYCEIKKDNIASIKAAERSGFAVSDTKGEMIYYSLDKR